MNTVRCFLLIVPLQAFGDPINDVWDELDEFTPALYHNNLVGVKKIHKTSIDLDRIVRKELKMVSFVIKEV